MILLAVRRESIILELEDNASREALQAAAALKVLDRSINSLSGTAVRTRAFQGVSRDVDKMGTSFNRAGSSIDTFSGRLGLLTQAALVLGPALAPIGASMVPAISGLATSMAGAAGAAAAAGLAFAGVGDALDALNKVHLEPSAENFLALQQAMDELGPAGANFARFLHSIGGELETLQRTAGANMFPGMQRGLESLVTLMPQADRLIAEFSSRLGDLAADAGASLAGPEWASFFSFLETDAAPIFDQFARATGNVALGLSNIMVAFAPLSRDFAAGMLEASRYFASWSADSSNFTEFIDYVRKIGPQVSDFLGSLAEAAVALTRAVAPWGSVVLPALTTLLDLFTAVAGSPIGPALTTAALAMLTLNKAMAASSMIMGRVGPAVGGMSASFGQMRADIGTVATTWATAGAATERESKRMAAATGRLKGNFAAIGKGAGIMGAVGIAATGAAQGVGLQNAAMLGLAGTMAGPWGAAAGAGVGLILDFKAAQDQAAASASELAGLLDQQTGALTRNYNAAVAAKMKPDDLEVLREAGVDIGAMTSALLEGGDAWSRFRAEMEASGIQESDWSLFGLGSSRGDVGEAMKNMENLAALVGASKDAFREQKPAADAAADSIAGTAAAVRELEAAQRAQNQATLASIDAGTRWGQAIANARKQADAGTKGFNHLTEAGRANRSVMSQLVGSYNAQSDAVKNSAKGYQTARAEVASVGEQMGLTRERVRQLQAALDKPSTVKVDGKQAMQTADSIRERIGKIPKDPTSKAHLNDQASGPISSILRQLQNLDGKTATTTVTNRTVNEIITISRGQSTRPDRHGALADGGTIPGQRYPYGDKVLMWGAPGEEVISNRNGQADAFRRDRAAGRIPAYAEGGTITLPGYAGGGKVRGWEDGPVYNALWESGRRDPSASLIAGMTMRQLAQLGAAFDDISLKRLNRFGRSIERAIALKEREADRAKENLDYWNNKRAEVKSQVTGSLERNWFGGTTGNVWADSTLSGGTAAFAQQQWKKQAADSKKLSATIANLRKNGAGDAFIAEILGSEDPLAAAQMFNKQSVGGLRHSQKLFLSATRATASAATSTSSIYADEQRAATAELRGVNKRIDRLEKLLTLNHKEAEATRKRESAAKATHKGARDRR